MVKGKRNGLTSTECSVKICRFLPLSSPYWKWSYHNATQSECAHRLRGDLGLTQEGMQEIKNNPQVYTTQEGIEEIKNNPQVYTTQEGIEDIKINPLFTH